MNNGIFNVPLPENEPVLGYDPGSPERESIRRQLDRMSRRRIEIPARIGGRKVRTGKLGRAVVPHDHGHVLATWHKCGRTEVERAIAAAGRAHAEWSRTPWEQRAAVFLRAAELLA
ncbi:MAG: aldehyde dehydrogenase family protein, partial [Acidobacteriota bacterium]|nr:aldehyde dehydrogenase family protein [Acidobacteriota bacterium]